MLINCPECNHEVSDTAKICPHCGYDITKITGYISDDSIDEEALDKEYRWLKILSLICPVIGYLSAIVFSSKGTPKDTYVGKECFGFASITVILLVFLYIVSRILLFINS